MQHKGDCYVHAVNLGNYKMSFSKIIYSYRDLYHEDLYEPEAKLRDYDFGGW